MKDAVLTISDADNVAIALEPLTPGAVIDVRGSTITVRDAIPAGHKVALAPIGEGGAIVKYGSPIGRATQPIAPGNHVHTHNLASTRGRGDLK